MKLFFVGGAIAKIERAGELPIGRHVERSMLNTSSRTPIKSVLEALVWGAYCAWGVPAPRHCRSFAALRMTAVLKSTPMGYTLLNTHVKSMQKAAAIMQRNKQSKPVTRLFRVLFRVLLTLVSIYGVLYLILLALTVLMRLKWVNDKVRRVSSCLGKRGDPLFRKIAGTRLGSLYFNLSTLKHVGRSN